MEIIGAALEAAALDDELVELQPLEDIELEDCWVQMPLVASSAGLLLY